MSIGKRSIILISTFFVMLSAHVVLLFCSNDSGLKIHPVYLKFYNSLKKYKIITGYRVRNFCSDSVRMSLMRRQILRGSWWCYRVLLYSPRHNIDNLSTQYVHSAPSQYCAVSRYKARETRLVLIFYQIWHQNSLSSTSITT